MREGLWGLAPAVALGVSKDGSLRDVHFARNFAEVNSGYVRGLDLLPCFVGDLSAHAFYG